VSKEAAAGAGLLLTTFVYFVFEIDGKLLNENHIELKKKKTKQKRLKIL
jgi:hypothetical protein